MGLSHFDVESKKIYEEEKIFIHMLCVTFSTQKGESNYGETHFKKNTFVEITSF